MNKTKQLVLRTSAKILAICSFMLVLSIWISINSLNYVKWSSENDAYNKWLQMDAPKICETASSKCGDELKLKYANSPSHIWAFSSEHNQCIRRIVGNIDCLIFEPTSLRERVVRSSRFEDFAVTFAIPFVVLYAFKFFFFIKHIGWQRIILSSAFVASFITAYIYDESHYSVDEFEMISYSIIAFLSAISLPYIIVHFVKWIREGFTNEIEANNMLNQIVLDDKNIEYFEISSDFLFALFKIFGIFILIIFAFLLRPEKTAQTFFVTFLQGVLFGIVYLIFEKWKSRQKKE